MSFYVCNQVYKFWDRIWGQWDRKWGFGVKRNGFHGRKTQNSRLLSGATHEASPWWAGGELPRPAPMFFVILGTCDRSGPFQTDSFDVIKCN